MSPKFQTKTFWEEIPLKNYLIAGVILNALSATVILILKSDLPPVVPLLYGRPVGSGQLVPTLGLLIAPCVCLLITIINALLSFLTKEDFIKKIFILSGFAISVLSAITIVKIVLLVGFF
jgi:hypothetical protein